MFQQISRDPGQRPRRARSRARSPRPPCAPRRFSDPFGGPALHLTFPSGVGSPSVSVYISSLRPSAPEIPDSSSVIAAHPPPSVPLPLPRDGIAPHRFPGPLRPRPSVASGRLGSRRSSVRRGPRVVGRRPCVDGTGSCLHLNRAARRDLDHAAAVRIEPVARGADLAREAVVHEAPARGHAHSQARRIRDPRDRVERIGGADIGRMWPGSITTVIPHESGLCVPMKTTSSVPSPVRSTWRLYSMWPAFRRQPQEAPVAASIRSMRQRFDWIDRRIGVELDGDRPAPDRACRPPSSRRRPSASGGDRRSAARVTSQRIFPCGVIATRRSEPRDAAPRIVIAIAR